MRRRRWMVAAGVIVLLLAAATGVARTWRSAARSGPVPGIGSDALPTATVVRTTVVQRQQVSGTLGYAGETQILNPGADGTLTWLPAPGTRVGRGEPLFEIDGVKTRLLLGDRPVWRDLRAGVPGGDDVLQLERNLVALGQTGFTVDRRFTLATEYAVRRWQAALGVPQTGELPAGSVVFAPGPLRAGAPVVPVGGRPQPGEPVLQATSTARVVSVALPTRQQNGVAVGARVYVTLVTGARLTGKITHVGRVASAAGTASGSAASGGTGPSGGGATGGSTGTGTATIPLSITLDPLPNGAPDPASALEESPVQVSITTRQHADVLAVPVTALVAATSGGYDVVLVTPGGATRTRAAVQPGLLDDITGLIEISGGGLSAGQLVEVPAP